MDITAKQASADDNRLTGIPEGNPGFPRPENRYDDRRSTVDSFR
jgi:hypothetical protein